MRIDASTIQYKELNEAVRLTGDTDITIDGVVGHRYIGAGIKGKKLVINGVPGNALGAYLDGSTIEVFGNAQDAIGDTMNAGSIIVHGNCGDTAGYGMRSGSVYIKGNAGYRVGIHMKEYMELVPTVVVGGVVGDFLGEYQAGGTIIVLGLRDNSNAGKPVVGHFCATGQHGGRIFIRTDELPKNLPAQVICRDADDDDKAFLRKYVEQYVAHFNAEFSVDDIMSAHFYAVLPNSKSPYKQLYTSN
ncbi:hypothetical protein FACS1894120_0420 [Clostridia bacterium]|nr:hypothetical protein FACS1894120_0420 [Clostridia bacterium]